MVNVFNQKYSIQFGLAILVTVSLACNISVNTKSNKPTVTNSGPTEEVVVFPTKSQASATPEEALAEMPTEEIPTEEVLPTATKKPVSKTPTRTAKPATATSIPVVRQSTQVEPVKASTEAVSSGGDITVTAATGNLFVRRGPGTTYNIVSGFSKGVTTKAVGRNEKNDWLAIEIPLAKGNVGWISLGTGYTELHGKLADLPLYPYEEPKPAYVQNCTLHDMTTRPGQWNLPAKTTQKVNPGEYQFLDMSTGQSKVMEATLKEGNTVYINVDGDGTSHSCP
jgi:hypothetical protein